jgi:putative transposase
MMQALGSGYVRSFNARHDRTGTLWEGRYFSSPVGSDNYLWNCHNYIELNPVRAKIVDHPGKYQWSSFAGNALGRPDPVLTPHPAYSALSSGSAPAHRAYQRMFERAPSDAEILEIRDRLKKERAYGSEEFLDAIEAVSARSPRYRGRGRPKESSTLEINNSDLFIRSRIGA